MKLSRITIVLVIVALTAGGAAAFGAQRYIEQAVARYQAGLESRYEAIKVVVAATDLPAGTVLGAGNVVTRDVPREFLHKDAIRANDWSQFNGRATRYDLTQGASVLRSHLLGPRGGRFAQLIDAGKRALTVPVDQISSISGMLSPGDRIDFLLTLRREQGPVTFPLMKDVPVLATGVRTDITKDGPGQYNTVTVLADPTEAAKLTHARDVGSLTVVLRATGDASDEWPAEVTVATLLGLSPSRPKAQRRRGRRIEVIIGGQGSTVR